jgi:Fur family transcriptional regulator, ferric uptake regulator
MTMQNDTRYAALLRTHGLKATPQRMQVLSLLAVQKKPVSIAELQQKAKLGVKGAKKSSIDTVTLYRSLEALMKNDLVRPVDLRHGHTDYELVEEGKHHHHIVCEKCGVIEDFNSFPEDELKKAFKKNSAKKSSKFATLTDHSLELFGICKKCAKLKT